MPKMARNRSALHDVLAQGASNRDITVIKYTSCMDHIFCVNMTFEISPKISYKYTERYELYTMLKF